MSAVKGPSRPEPEPPHAEVTQPFTHTCSCLSFLVKLKENVSLSRRWRGFGPSEDLIIHQLSFQCCDKMHENNFHLLFSDRLSVGLCLSPQRFPQRTKRKGRWRK